MRDKSFFHRHVGSTDSDVKKMLDAMSFSSTDQLIKQVIPSTILSGKQLGVGDAISESDYLTRAKALASKNKMYKSFIGQGFYGTSMPSAIKRNMLENPGWYTSYTPYQAEISQGRLEALLNYQTVVCDMTAMPVSNASLLDEGTAAAEAMIMFYNSRGKQQVSAGANVFFVDSNVFSQTKNVVASRAKALDIEIVYGDWQEAAWSEACFGCLVQYPDAKGEVSDYKQFVADVHARGGFVCVAADLLSLAVLTPPGEWGADATVGSTQRFGLPMAYGGPHAGFFATTSDFTRKIPGRIIGKTIDAEGNPALRMALQTREQHIKREKATSNICTSQALLANMSGMYAVYHGKEGLQAIATRISRLARTLFDSLKELGITCENRSFFDTISIKANPGMEGKVREVALQQKVNFYYTKENIRISIDETTTLADVGTIISIVATAVGTTGKVPVLAASVGYASSVQRCSDFLKAPVFNSYRCETDLMRYIKSLENKDFSLVHGMIPLGSCTMKLNAATEMMALSWDEFGNMHPFVPRDQAEGYEMLIADLSNLLCKVTGFAGISFQPNSGASGEYAGLLVIKAFHAANDQAHRNIILIPSSAHGTNPASAIMAGFVTVTVACDLNGNISLDDMAKKVKEHEGNVAGAMITYPSTHGVFEEDVMSITKLIRQAGGLVYMDGANMNAQVGYTNPAAIGADLCHLNLHKTFAIPHGGGGPGVGPVLVRKGLEQFLPSPEVWKEGENTVSSAPYGSAMVLTIAYAYIKLLGDDGLKNSTALAIVNANYLAQRLRQHYPILYTDKNGRCAHEMILDCREFKKTAGIEVTDIAKRLMDYGFHAPTVSFPVAGTLMVEPTESEPLKELDRFVDAMVSIRHEISQIENGQADQANNLLKNAPHTARVVTDEEWTRPYSRQQAAFPMTSSMNFKYWPTVSRVNDAHGDRNLVCTC